MIRQCAITPNTSASAEAKILSATGKRLENIFVGTRMTLNGEKSTGRRRGGGTLSIRKSAMPTLMIGINTSEPQLSSTTARHALVAASPLTSSSALTTSTAVATGLESSRHAVALVIVG